MEKQNLMPQAAHPVNRIATGQLPTELAELSEAALQLNGDSAFSSSVLPSSHISDDDLGRWYVTATTEEFYGGHCSYAGDDAE